MPLINGLMPVSISAGMNPQQPGGDGAGQGEPVSEEMKRQAPLEREHMRLEQAIAKANARGFAALNVDFDSDRIDLYWKGHLPDTLGAAVEDVRQRHGVTVHQAAYSWAELDNEVRRILALVERNDELKFISAVMMEPDMSGIQLLVSEESAVTANAQAEVGSLVEPTVSWKLGFEDWAANIAPTVPGNRWDDRAPYIGAAVIQTYILGIIVDARCTTAFTVRNSADTARGVLTAKHCSDGENHDWYTPEGNFVGESNLIVSDRDLMGIMWPRSAGGYPGFRGNIYIGGYSSSTMENMSGSGSSTYDALYTTSGGYSGVRQFNRVIARNVYPSGFGGPMFVTRKTDGTAAVGNGDSGGATYRHDVSVSPSRRYARGVISLIDLNRERPCAGMPTGDGRVCSDTVYHVELQNALNGLGLRVLTAS